MVAENGAVLYDTARGATTTLAEAPPVKLVEALARDGVPVSIGSTIVATGESHQFQLVRVIRELGLAWHVIPNRGARAALPMDVTKATGLLRALAEIGTTADRTVGVGDAENDVVFLRMYVLAAAVSNALPCVQEATDIVTERAHGAGVAQLIDRWLAGELSAIRRGCPVGVRDARRRLM